MEGVYDNIGALPEGWQRVMLDDVITVIRGASPRPKGDPRYFGGDIPWIMISDITREKGKFISQTKDHVTEAGAEKSRYLKAGTLILSNSGTVCVPKILSVDGCIHDGFVAFPNFPEEFNILYLYYYFEFIRPKIINAHRQGITQVNLNTGIVKSIQLPIAPYAQQKRIVTEIEKQFSRLDEAVSNLKRVKANLKRYKAAVLKAAVEGKLTEEWRTQHPDVESASKLLERILTERRKKWEGAELAKMKAKGKIPKNDTWKKKYKEPECTETGDFTIPQSWSVATVQQLAERVQYGSSSKTNEDESGVPVLRMGNIFEGELVLDKLKYLPQKHNEFPKLLLEENDLLFNRTNSPELVGKTAVYKGKPVPCSFVSYLIRVQMLPGVEAKFVSYYINSMHGRQWVKSVVSQQVGQANVNGTKLQALILSVPPTEEQKAIVSEMETRFSLMNGMEVAVETNLLRAERLRQSILSKAFSGRLIGGNA